MIAAPFHAGERTLQALAGSREQMEVAGPRVIRDYMPATMKGSSEKNSRCWSGM